MHKGVLYIVSTPIGNLEDISFRAVSILENADLIACEDTRKTNFLLSQYGIRNKTISYYSQVEASKAEQIINEIRSGKTVALVSDAGTPCISDPGNILVSKCIEENIDVYSVPGCSSLIHALILSGIPTGKFFFQGFLPQKKGRQTLLKELSGIKMTLIIFESPFRIYKTLNDIHQHIGNKETAVCRELTKKFEQIIRGKVKNLLAGQFKTKGEFVIIVNNN
ncbi:MAG: 16S rRNA (cytidine(1402)-2'-O)-methyltransferase [Bacteroidetes bacterium]|nr:16S rRNA (cytidine(1402)-2'-O)-methyltransferase [Bacteroidota bacterium]